VKLSMSFMFSSLDEREQEIVIDAMEERIAVANEKIIVEGELGDCLYVVGSGTLTCTKVF
jgi:cAMP-dependent protein kinase regulator